MNQEIESLRQQLADSETEGLEQARLLGMSGEREAALLYEIDRLRNQLVAANAELVRKQDRDSQYSNVCCKLSARENEVIQLRQQLTEKDAEIERLKAAIVMRFDHDTPPQFEQGCSEHEVLDPVTAEHCRWFVSEIELLRQQLTASQAREQQLRETLEFFFPDWRNYNPLSWQYKAKQALSLPSDTTALSAMITKAGEVMRERVFDECFRLGILSLDGRFMDDIRALPGVTLDDLQK